MTHTWKRKNREFVLEEAGCICRVKDDGSTTFKDPSGHWTHARSLTVKEAKQDCEFTIEEFSGEQKKLAESRWKASGRERFMRVHGADIKIVRLVAKAIHSYAFLSPPEQRAAKSEIMKLKDTNPFKSEMLRLMDNKKVLKAALSEKEFIFVERAVDNFIHNMTLLSDRPGS